MQCRASVAGAVDFKIIQCAMAVVHAELMAVGMTSHCASPPLLLCCAASCDLEIYWVFDGKCHRHTCHTVCLSARVDSIVS